MAAISALSYFPDAAAKLFVTASLTRRARRRWLELQCQECRYRHHDSVEEDMRQRDAKDAAAFGRAARGRPMMRSELDTSEMDAETAFQSALVFVRRIGEV